MYRRYRLHSALIPDSIITSRPLSRLVFLIILFGVGYLIYHLYGKALRKQGPKGLLKPALIAGAALILLAVVSGKASPIFAAIGGLIAAAWRMAPLLVRFYPQIRQLLNKVAPGVAGGTGNVSKVTTAMLVMSLDHATGRIDGEITAGKFKNQTLSQLSFDEILQFYQICEKQDREALRLLQAFLEREFPEQWQQATGANQTGNEPPGQNGAMSVAEAWEILGLAPGADKATISATHKKLMGRLHPDKGGSNFLASRVNQAKDRLLEELQKKQEKQS